MGLFAGKLSAISRKLKESAKPAADVAAAPAAPAPSAALTAPSAPAAPKPMSAVKLDTSGLTKQFDVARSRAASTESAGLQGQRDAINRRLASMGGGPAGVGLKLEQQASDESAKRLASANEGIEAAQSQALQQVKEQEAQLNFAREEAFAGRDFAAQQAGADRDWRAAQANLDRSIQESQFGKQLDLSWKQFEQSKLVDKFNMDLATKFANEKDAIEALLSPLVGGGWSNGFAGGGLKGGALGGTVGGLVMGPLGAGMGAVAGTGVTKNLF